MIFLKIIENVNLYPVASAIYSELTGMNAAVNSGNR